MTTTHYNPEPLTADNAALVLIEQAQRRQRRFGALLFQSCKQHFPITHSSIAQR